MKIQITDVRQTDRGCLVSFDSNCGPASGIWMGEPPVTGDERFVEFEFGEGLVRDSNVFEVESTASLIEGDEIWTLNATIERIEPDGIVIVRFGDDVILAEIEGEPFIAGTPIQIHSRELKLYDANL